MLASTVQFSTYDQTPITLHRQTCPPHGETQRYDRRPALSEKKRPSPDNPGVSALSGPNSVPTNRTPRTDSAPRTPRKGMQYWEPAPRAGRTGQCSTLEHHPRHSAAIRDWMAVTAWARVWTTSTSLAASAP